MTTYDIGDRRTLSCSLNDNLGAPLDPTTLVFEMREPDGTITTWTFGTDIQVARDSVGRFHVDWDITQSGTHYYRFAASGNIGSAEESSFGVRQSVVLGSPAAYTWPIDRTCLPELPTISDPPADGEQAAYDLALAQRNGAEDMAVHVLWALSGRQFGIYTTTVRPCAQQHGWGIGPVFWPYILTSEFGHWSDRPCGCLGNRCTISGPRVVHLPGPAVAVTAVTVEGVTLDPADYALENDALYRRGAHWPRQDLGRPLSDPGTWSVTYTRGTPAPAGTDRLAGMLAKEFVAICTGDKCSLPRTMVSAARQGVSYQFDVSKILDAGRTGLPEVDLWLAAVNPYHLVAAPVVL